METTIKKKGRPKGVLNPKPKEVIKDYNWHLQQMYKRGEITKDYLEMYTNSTKKRVPPAVSVLRNEIRNYYEKYAPPFKEKFYKDKR